MEAVSRDCCWAIAGRVVHGHGRGGSQLGFPTANVGLDATTINLLMPFQNWVYYGWGCVEGPNREPGVVYPFVMSVGFNPHFHDKALAVEAHFLHHFDADFYEATVRLIVCGALREQSAFTTLQALIQTIRADITRAEQHLGSEEALWCKAHKFLAAPRLESSLPIFVADLRKAPSSL